MFPTQERDLARNFSRCPSDPNPPRFLARCSTRRGWRKPCALPAPFIAVKGLWRCRLGSRQPRPLSRRSPRRIPRRVSQRSHAVEASRFELWYWRRRRVSAEARAHSERRRLLRPERHPRVHGRARPVEGDRRLRLSRWLGAKKGRDARQLFGRCLWPRRSLRDRSSLSSIGTDASAGPSPLRSGLLPRDEDSGRARPWSALWCLPKGGALDQRAGRT